MTYYTERKKHVSKHTSTVYRPSKTICTGGCLPVQVTILSGVTQALYFHPGSLSSKRRPWGWCFRENFHPPGLSVKYPQQFAGKRFANHRLKMGAFFQTGSECDRFPGGERVEMRVGDVGLPERCLKKIPTSCSRDSDVYPPWNLHSHRK